MDDFELLLAKAKAASAGLKNLSNPKSNLIAPPVGMPPLHYGLPRIYYATKKLPIGDVKDRMVVDVFSPTKIPSIELSNGVCILHGHKPLLPCKSDTFCHELGFSSDNSEFKAKWNYLYGHNQRLNELRFE